ncbi:MAG: NUDIX hydrolase [Nocardioidaceae bacterium]|nr:NUDIX hydrolase [Nocardioidaceae bacterium]
MDPTRKLPPSLVAHAKAFLAGTTAPVTPKGAATVVLLRDGGAGLEVYLLRRHLGMAFAAGMYAFPGGTVDRRDADHATAWAGPSAADWATRLHCSESETRSLVGAAVRETFEESGVLLAGTTADTVVQDTTGEGWERDRAALVDKRLAFADLLEQRGLVLRTDLLAAWAHWITPEFEPRRYDTRFFVAVIPPGQLTRDVSGEADTETWMRPQDAVAGVDGGTMAMLPPTYITIAEMGRFATAAEAIAAADGRVIAAVVPGVEVVDGEGFLIVPDEVLP